MTSQVLTWGLLIGSWGLSALSLASCVWLTRSIREVDARARRAARDAVGHSIGTFWRQFDREMRPIKADLDALKANDRARGYVHVRPLLTIARPDGAA